MKTQVKLFFTIFFFFYLKVCTDNSNSDPWKWKCKNSLILKPNATAASVTVWRTHFTNSTYKAVHKTRAKYSNQKHEYTLSIQHPLFRSASMILTSFPQTVAFVMWFVSFQCKNWLYTLIRSEAERVKGISNARAQACHTNNSHIEKRMCSDEITPVPWTVQTWPCVQLVCRWYGPKLHTPSSSSAGEKSAMKRLNKPARKHHTKFQSEMKLYTYRDRFSSQTRSVTDFIHLPEHREQTVEERNESNKTI